MWIIDAFLGAFFLGIMAVLAKIGLKQIDTNLATALRTIVVLTFAWLVVFLQHPPLTIDSKSLLFLVISGLTNGAAWLFYFKALQLGDVNQIAPVDKFSLVITMLLSMLFLQEPVTGIKICGMLTIFVGTFLMIEKKSKKTPLSWLPYALLSATFTSLTAILSKIGIQNVDSNLGTAIRTVVVLVMAWLLVFWQGSQKDISTIDKKSWLFIVLSGLATGLSWMFYYRALQTGPASIVVPIDKLSILVTVFFGYFFLKEKLTKKGGSGLILIVAGTLILLL